MKISIMTLGLSNNFGAVLQTYATAKAFDKLGESAEVYKYNDYKRITAGMSFKTKVKHYGWLIVKQILTLCRRTIKFNKFRKSYIPFTKKRYRKNEDLRAAPGDYDVYVAGSDQIWNPDIFANDTSYFLDFVPKKKKKISYASSFGKPSFTVENRQKYEALLNDFEFLSVRENSGIDIIQSFSKKNVQTVLDPTLLLNHEDWHKLSLHASTKAQNFNGILCYIMPGDKKVTDAMEQVAQQLSKKTNLPILRLGLKEYEVFKYGMKETDIFAGPLDFLAYFENAAYVVTNSFHGTAFSVNFSKNFYVVVNNKIQHTEKLSERMMSLLQLVQATDAIINADNPTLSDKKTLDLEKIQTNLNKERRKSYDYLNRAINENRSMVTEKNHCFGCSACYSICPKNAIKMTKDVEGFLFPKIDKSKCVDCGLCVKVCPAEKIFQQEDKPQYAVALQHNNNQIRSNSTSGAAFVALSNAILQSNGVVYGVTYDENFVAQYTRAVTAQERDNMCGSKYSQAKIDNILSDVLTDLTLKRPVFFSGTSCQIDGLLRFLKEKKCDCSLLITCDLICHGVPSPQIWQDHIHHIENIRKKKIQTYIHRSKVAGWHGHNEYVLYHDGSIEWRTKLIQNFKDLFYGHYIIRPSCETCPYAGQQGVADISIGDFWGCEDLMPEIDDNKGTSIVIVNSKKGDALLKVVATETNLWQVPLENAIKYNHSKPTKMNSNREQFWIDYRRDGFSGVIKKYAHDSFHGKIYYYGKKMLRSLLVKMHILHI